MSDQQDNDNEAWGRGVVSPNLVSFSEGAKAKILAYASSLEDDKVLALIWMLSSATYDKHGDLQETRSSHVGMGSYYRAQIPTKYITSLCGIDVYLRIDPHCGETPLKSAKVWIENDRFEAEFDPPAQVHARTFPKRVEDQPGYREAGNNP